MVRMCVRTCLRIYIQRDRWPSRSISVAWSKDICSKLYTSNGYVRRYKCIYHMLIYSLFVWAPSFHHSSRTPSLSYSPLPLNTGIQSLRLHNWQFACIIIYTIHWFSHHKLSSSIFKCRAVIDVLKYSIFQYEILCNINRLLTTLLPQ